MVESPHKKPSLLHNKNFMLLWGGQTISQLGSTITILALPLIAVAVLKVSTLQVGVLSSAGNLAYLGAAPLVGVIVERLNKRRLMILCDVSRALILAVIPAAAILGHINIIELYVVAFISGVFTVFFDIAYQSYPPNLLRADQLLECNTKLGASASVTQVAGPSIGAVLVSTIGAAKTIVSDALSYVVSAISLYFINAAEEAPPKRQEETQATVWSQIREGFSYLVGQTVLFRITVYTSLVNLLMTVASSVEIIYLIRVLHVRTSRVGLLISLAEIGGIGGGLIAGVLSRRIGSARIIWLAPTVFNVIGLLTPLAQPGWSALLYSIGWGGFSASAVIFNIAALTYRQATTPNRLLSRVSATSRWLVYGTMPFGGLVGGALGTLIGVRQTLWIALGGAWAASILLLASPLRRMRDIPTKQG